jgi:hypothetical protein
VSPTGGGSRGRRDNGLDAAKFTPAADVDPRVGEHLLDVLGLAGIAAYLAPSSDLHPITRTTTLPSRPTDRLWVDERHVEEARALIGRLDLENVPEAEPAEVEAETTPASASPSAPGPPSAPARTNGGDLDVEAAWAQIVAGWDDTAERSGSGQATEPAEQKPAAPEPPRADRPAPGKPAPIIGLDLPFDASERVTDPDGEDRYVPPVPPPLPKLTRYTALALGLVAVGVVLFFWPAILPINQTFVVLLGLAGVVTGFGIGVWRMRDRDDDDPYDDGAKV